MSRVDDIENVRQLGYEFGTLIGKGCYGKVFRAKFIDTNGPIELACKYIIKKKCANDFLTKFLPREIEIIKQVNHMFIVETFSIIQTSSSIFIFMRYCENGDLLSYIKKNGALPENIANVWFYQLVSAINYLHSLNIAHRDLKCENILITKNMNLKIADFGFARYSMSIADFFSVTEMKVFSETYCGSAAYAPPEVVSGIPYDIMKVDVWSLGIILSIMINAKMPFDDSNLAKLIRDQKTRNYNTNAELMKNIKEECKLVLYYCLEPDPNIRWSSCDLLQTPWIQYQVKNYANKKR